MFQCDREQFLNRIVDLHGYKNLREYLNAEGGQFFGQYKFRHNGFMTINIR